MLILEATFNVNCGDCMKGMKQERNKGADEEPAILKLCPAYIRLSLAVPSLLRWIKITKTRI